MSNLRLTYLYRDADNYKLFGSEIFSNPDKLSCPEVTTMIKSSLIDREFFYPSEWGLPLLHSDDGWGMEDTDWCEFLGVEQTNDNVTMGSVSVWLKRIGR